MLKTFAIFINLTVWYMVLYAQARIAEHEAAKRREQILLEYQVSEVLKNATGIHGTGSRAIN